MNNENRLSCAVTQDLLPLYHDRVVSEQTRKQVDEHLKWCVLCRNEYHELCDELPILVDDKDAKGGFRTTMSRKKRRNILSSIVITLLVLAVLFGTFQLLRKKPLVKLTSDEIHIERVYPYESNGQKKLFILYTAPWDYLGWPDYEMKKDGTVTLSIKKPVISSTSDDYYTTWYECYLSSTVYERDIIKSVDAAKVIFGGQVIWTAADSDAGNVPDFVYAFDGNLSYFTDIDNETQQITITYPDGTKTTWDYDGNVIFDNHNK